MAHAARGESDEAGAELAILEAIARESPLVSTPFASGSTPSQLLDIGSRVLSARIALAAGDSTSAIAALREAVELQDALPYTEPPPWYFPTREALGRALLAAGEPAQAEAVFREQLEHTPRNGWSLHGLAESLRAQGRDRDAAAAQAEFDEVWERADFELT